MARRRGKSIVLTARVLEDVVARRDYLHDHIGKLGFMICSKLPNQEAHAKRNIIFREDRKLVLFITVEHLLEMIAYREVDEDRRM